MPKRIDPLQHLGFGWRFRVMFWFYSLEHKLRSWLGLKPRWRWEVCLGCGPFIRCPTCAANCGWTGMVDGDYCPTCKTVNETWRNSRTDGTMPCKGKFSRDAILKEKGKRYSELEEQGVMSGDLEGILGIATDEVTQNEDGSITLRSPPDTGPSYQNEDGSITSEPPPL